MSADVNPIDWARTVVGSVESFADAMKEQGIHVGIGTGNNVRCAACGESWPCAAVDVEPQETK
jgi:hypothetical protein